MVLSHASAHASVVLQVDSLMKGGTVTTLFESHYCWRVTLLLACFKVFMSRVASAVLVANARMMCVEHVLQRSFKVCTWHL